MRILVASLFILFAADASAAVLYKLVDPDGRVTFADNVPLGYPGLVTRMDIETGTNVITPTPSGNALARAPLEYDVVAPRPVLSGEERLRNAARRLEDARFALADAQNNSRAEDWVYFGRENPLGMRRAPRPEYQARLDQLANNVVVAQGEYDALRNDLR